MKVSARRWRVGLTGTLLCVIGVSFLRSSRVAAAGVQDSQVAAVSGGTSAGTLPPDGAGASRINPVFAAEFDKVWETVRDRYYDKSLSGVDWRRVGAAYRARLPEVKSKAEFADLVNQMLGELHASHTAYATDEDIEFYMLPAVMSHDLRGHRVEHIGVTGQRVGREYIVSAVLDGGPAERAGIQSGDHLLSVEGKPFQSAGSFVGKEGVPVRVELQRGSESDTRTVTVVPVRQNTLRAFLDATNKSVRIFQVDGRRIGYVHLWVMAHEAFKSALDDIVLNRLHNTDGLILDLRDGYGGSPWGFADVFFRPDIAWEQQARGIDPSSRRTGYNKPMVVLVNGGTRSAKEFLTYQLKAGHRALIVGTPTAGAFLGAGTFEIGKDGLLELAVVGLRVNGKQLEGIGVLPDIEVTPEFPYTERDGQLARAKQALADMLKRRTAGNSSQGDFTH
jgi:carboxyl-terminal processing protease